MPASFSIYDYSLFNKSLPPNPSVFAITLHLIRICTVVPLSSIELIYIEQLSSLYPFKYLIKLFAALKPNIIPEAESPDLISKISSPLYNKF